jgi:hypothetical protein
MSWSLRTTRDSLGGGGVRPAAGRSGFRVYRCPVPAEALVNGAAYDYADSFEVRLEHPDTHSAEQWARAALEHAPPTSRRLIRLVHARVLRFRLGPCSDANHILGWPIVTADHGVVHLETAGPLLRALIILRRTSPTCAAATTFVFYERSTARPLWVAVGPLHRRIAPYLLQRAAASMTQTDATTRRTSPDATTG